MFLEFLDTEYFEEQKKRIEETDLCLVHTVKTEKKNKNLTLLDPDIVIKYSSGIPVYLIDALVSIGCHLEIVVDSEFNSNQPVNSIYISYMKDGRINLNTYIKEIREYLLKWDYDRSKCR